MNEPPRSYREELRMWARALLPTWIVGAYALVVLPSDPGTHFADLALHQKAGSVAVTASLPWSFYRRWQMAGEEVLDDAE